MPASLLVNKKGALVPNGLSSQAGANQLHCCIPSSVVLNFIILDFLCYTSYREVVFI